ncbi:MAG: transposase [Acidobacteria bacterium]|nr:transposase [Acidobacteriota bacterium]
MNPAYTSQDCSQCGSRAQVSCGKRAPLHQLRFCCASDHNAAINIQSAGHVLRGWATKPV